MKDYQDPSIQTISALPEVKEMKMTSEHKPKVLETKFNAVKPESNSIETIFKYMESKIKEIKAFEGSFLAIQAKEELKTFMKVLENNEGLMEKFRAYNPEIAIELKVHMQTQRQFLNKGFER